jgi:hypothetical protein
MRPSELKAAVRAFQTATEPLLMALYEAIEKISGKIESATAEYKAEHAVQRPEPTIHAILNRPQGEIEEEEARYTHKKEYENRHEGRDRVRLVVECFALAVGIIVAVANIELWIVTAKSVEISAAAAEAAKRGAIASESQVKATQESIQATVNSFQLDQRAWLGANKIGLVDSIDLGSTIKGLIELTNTGKTPAKKVRTLGAIEVLAKGVVPIPKYQVDHTDQTSYSVIQPGMSMTITTPAIKGASGEEFGTTNQTDLDDLKSGRFIIYIFGEITYEDVFGRPHITKFCGFVNRNLQTVRACQTYNDAD